MCRLSLVNYLVNHLGGDHKNLMYEVVFALEPDEKVAADKQVASAKLWPELDKCLRDVTVVDETCGSGSFLVGMLHVLDDLQARANAELGRSELGFDRKKRIVGQSLYGVDVMDWACHVTELRLWLALTVDIEFTSEELHVRREPLLPYFTFKVRPGDSLIQEVGGLNLGRIHASRDIPAALKGRITRLKTEKLKFYNNDPTGTLRSASKIAEEELLIVQ
jgi:hypothetical protein